MILCYVTTRLIAIHASSEPVAAILATPYLFFISMLFLNRTGLCQRFTGSGACAFAVFKEVLL